MFDRNKKYQTDSASSMGAYVPLSKVRARAEGGREVSGLWGGGGAPGDDRRGKVALPGAWCLLRAFFPFPGWKGSGRAWLGPSEGPSATQDSEQQACHTSGARDSLYKEDGGPSGGRCVASAVASARRGNPYTSPSRCREGVRKTDGCGLTRQARQMCLDTGAT